MKNSLAIRAFRLLQQYKNDLTDYKHAPLDRNQVERRIKVVEEFLQAAEEEAEGAVQRSRALALP